MKKAVLTSGLFLCMLYGAAAQEAVKENVNAPEIVFETEVIDYGTIEYKSNGVREFKFTNTGKEPLVISRAKGT